MPARLTFDFDPEDWACNLRCGRCDHQKRGGGQCRNRVCIGFSKCWIHSQQAYGVRVKPSTIPNSGRGLFAARAFAANEWICPYGGEAVSGACIDTRYGDLTAPYADTLSQNRYLDAACVRGIGSMAQGLFRANSTRPRALSAHNAMGAVRKRNGVREVWLKATKAIQPNAEIFHYYGDEYRLEDTHRTKRRSAVDTRPC